MEWDLGVAGGQAEGDFGDAVNQRRRPHEAKRNDITAEAGVFYLLQVDFDFFGGHGGSNV
jgi:hypothetical protein